MMGLWEKHWIYNKCNQLNRLVQPPPKDGMKQCCSLYWKSKDWPHKCLNIEHFFCDATTCMSIFLLLFFIEFPWCGCAGRSAVIMSTMCDHSISSFISCQTSVRTSTQLKACMHTGKMFLKSNTSSDPEEPLSVEKNKNLPTPWGTNVRGCCFLFLT